MDPLFVATIGSAVLLGLVFGARSEKHTRNLLVLTILFVHIDIYRLEVSPANISLFRYLLVVTAASFFVNYVTVNHRRNDSGVQRYTTSLDSRVLVSLVFVGLAVISLVVSLIPVTDFGEALPRLLRSLSGVGFVCLILGIVSDKRDVVYCISSYLLSYSYHIFFLVYTYYQWFVHGQVITDVPFRNVIPVELGSGGHLQEFIVSTAGISLPRLALPYTSPPILSITLVIGIFLCLYFVDLGALSTRTVVFIPFLPAFLVALVLSISRTGIFTLILVGSLGSVVFVLVRGYQINYGRITVVSLFIGAILVLLVPEHLILHRLTGSLEAHIVSRMHGLTIWTTDVSSVFFGVGLGNYIVYSGAHTPETHYVLFLAERGIIGTVLALPIFVYPVVLLSRNVANSQHFQTLKINFVWFCIALVLLVGELFYDFITAPFAWAAVGLGIAVAVHFTPTRTDTPVPI